MAPAARGGLRNRPGEGAFIGDADDEADLAREIRHAAGLSLLAAASRAAARCPVRRRRLPVALPAGATVPPGSVPLTAVRPHCAPDRGGPLALSWCPPLPSTASGLRDRRGGSASGRLTDREFRNCPRGRWRALQDAATPRGSSVRRTWSFVANILRCLHFRSPWAQRRWRRSLRSERLVAEPLSDGHCHFRGRHGSSDAPRDDVAFQALPVERSAQARWRGPAAVLARPWRPSSTWVNRAGEVFFALRRHLALLELVLRVTDDNSESV